jgi:hypothetical protein
MRLFFRGIAFVILQSYMMASTVPSRCARLGCNHVLQLITGSAAHFIMPDGPVREKIYRPCSESTSLCDTHLLEYEALFNVAKMNMQIDVDQTTGTIDFVSGKKSASKVPEKTFSIFPISESDSFRITSATCNGKLVKPTKLRSMLTTETLGKRSRDGLEGTAQQIGTLSLMSLPFTLLSLFNNYIYLPLYSKTSYRVLRQCGRLCGPRPR